MPAPPATSSVSIAPEKPAVLPLWTLSSTELERRRAEKNRILDLLEEEERIEDERDEEAEEEEKRKAAQKRRDAAKQDIAGLKAARELQRKMGRALLRDVVEDKEKKVPLEEEPLQERKGPKSQKNVSFALPEDGQVEPTANQGYSEDGVDWGDVVPARLRPTGAAATPPTSYGPMKTMVVERFPNTAATVEDSLEKDSDDESVPGSPPISDDESPAVFQADDRDEDDDESSEDDDDDGDLELDDQEFDLDKAQHQREIALEYYEKRNRIGAQAAAALTSHTHDADEDPWDQPVRRFTSLPLRR